MLLSLALSLKSKRVAPLCSPDGAPLFLNSFNYFTGRAAAVPVVSKMVRRLGTAEWDERGETWPRGRRENDEEQDFFFCENSLAPSWPSGRSFTAAVAAAAAVERENLEETRPVSFFSLLSLSLSLSLTFLSLRHQNQKHTLLQASSSVAPTRRAALAPTRRSSSAAPAPANTPLTPPPSALALAPALDLAPQASALSDADRAGLAEALGYRTIGAELPSDVSLTDVIKSMPSSVFDINPWRAWGAVATTVAAVAFSAFLIQNSPWYLLPLAWAFAGTAWTGMFVIGHDCGHRSFSHNKLVEDIVGTIAFMPLIYPFEPWRIKHNHHHAHTNKLVEDTAWHPVPKSDVEKWGPVQGALYKFFLGSPLKLWASVGHWAIWHFNLGLYTEKQRPRVLVSLAACALFAFVGIPAICHLGGGIGHGGVTAVLKHWLAPWLGYHFWMSTFTVVHHTAPHIPFKPAGEWNAAKAQLSGTVRKKGLFLLLIGLARGEKTGK